MNTKNLKQLAERYFHVVYGNDTAVVEELAAPEVSISRMHAG